MKKRVWLFAWIMTAAFSLLFYSIPGNAAQSIKTTGQWPHENSDLAPDPDLVFGRLPNGVRYVVMENRNPKNRVSLHLNVQAGSLHETDNQQGLAHYLEHILFCGSEHFKPGELIVYFQRIGMQFGPDANAHTGFIETVYDVLLPNGYRKSLSDGLLVLKDYAQGALILESEVDRERKVILAEKRTRDSAAYRTFVSSMKFELPESLISQRIPIGIEATIKTADRDLLKSFYDTWYRPERFIVVMVGDLDTAQAISLIEKKFSSFSARAPEQPEPDIGEIDHKGIKAFYHFEQEEGETSVTIETVNKIPRHPDSFNFQKAMLIRDVANRIVQNRLDAMIRKPDNPFTSATVNYGIYLHEVEYAEINGECNPENWQATLELLEQTLRKAIKYGFTQPELEKVKKEMLSELDNAVKEAPTRKSQDHARNIIRHLNNDRVLQSPKQEKKLFVPVVEALTLESVHLAFKKVWASLSRLVLVSGNAKLADDEPEKLILATLENSRQKEVLPPETKEAVKFPYLPEPEEKGVIKRRKEISDPAITQIDFFNGIRLNIKKTDFKANEVMMTAVFGKGRSCEPPERPGLASFSSRVINESGVGKLTKDDVRWALAGKNTHISFHVNEERFNFNGISVSGEISLLFQLLYTHLTDPIYKQDAYLFAMEQYKQEYASWSHTIDGAMQLSGKRFLAGGDSRFGLPPFQVMKKVTIDDIRSWIIPEIERNDLEISIVGDLDVETVMKIASKYIGGLPPGEKKHLALSAETVTFPAGKTLDIRVPTQIPKGLVQVVYPTEDFWEIKRTRRFLVLSHVVSEMMRKRIREKLGAAYAAYAYNSPSKAYKGYGRFHTVVQVDPREGNKVISEIKKIASDLSKTGITEDQLRLALDPIITAIKDRRRTNSYWLNSVLKNSKDHPEQLEWSRTLMNDLSSISTQDLSSLAGIYLDNTKAAAIVVRPTEF